MCNYVKFKCKCPSCKEIVKNFQTKQGDSDSGRLEPWTVNRFYSICKNCNTYIEYYTDYEISDNFIQEGLQAVKLLKESTEFYEDFPKDLKDRIWTLLLNTAYPYEDSWLENYTLTIDKLPPPKK